jgi:hypothetical protein
MFGCVFCDVIATVLLARNDKIRDCFVVRQRRTTRNDTPLPCHCERPKGAWQSPCGQVLCYKSLVVGLVPAHNIARNGAATMVAPIIELEKLREGLQ